MAQDFGEKELVKEQGKGSACRWPCPVRGAHTQGQETAPSPLPQSLLSSPGKATLSQPLEAKEMESPTASRVLSPHEGFLLLKVRGGASAQSPVPRGSPSKCAAWCRARARLSRGFSEKQLSSDPAGSTFLHDEGGIPVFTLNNVFLCLNRTHYVLNSSRFLAPHCSSSGTETGLRPLAEARANSGLV